MAYRYLFIILFFNYSFAQVQLKGFVNTADKKAVVFASVQLLLDNKTIAYTTTDDNGFFEFTYQQQNSNYSLKIAHVSYETQTKVIESINKEIIIILEEKLTSLTEVVVQSKQSVAKIKGDTLSYNLKALTTGNEEKLVDVLKKLPGIEINDDGKIMSKGKVVDNLLVNGQKMFGDNHKIASENINAEMLEGIDLLSNYETFSAIKEIEGSNKTALNINIKKEYLGKITGNLDLFGAYLNRYQLNSNLFKFNQKLNFSSIINLNNTGYQPLSVKDYFSKNKSVRQELRNNDASTSTLNSNDIPQFILSDNNVNKKSNEFIAMDFAYQPSEKLSVNGFSILSRLKTKDVSSTNKVFFDSNNSSTIFENLIGENGIIYNQTKINVDYKQSKNSLINYTFLFDSNIVNTSTKFINNLNNKQNEIFELSDKLNYKLGHQLSYISKISNNTLISFNIFQEFNKNNNEIDINSSYNLFHSNYNNLTQNTIEKNNDYGIYSKVSIKKKELLYKFSIGYIFENSQFNTTSMIDKNKVNFQTNYFTTDASFQKSEGKFNYKAKAEVRLYNLNFNAENKEMFFLLPTLQTKYNFSQTHHLLLNYSKIIDFYSSSNLNTNEYFDSFRNYYSNSNILYNTPLAQNIFSLNYFKFDLYNGVVILLNSSYTLFGNRLSNNNHNKTDFIEIQKINTENQYAWNNLMSYEHRISKIRNKFKISFNYINADFVNQISSIENTQKTELYGIKSSFISIFKNEIFNYEFGLNYSKQLNYLSLQNIENQVIQFNPFVSFNGKLNSKLSYFIDNSFENYKSNNESTNFYNLSFKLNYKNKKIKYWIEANNMLNLDNAKVIKFVTRNNFTSTEIIDRLAGYIGVGLSFDLR